MASNPPADLPSFLNARVEDLRRLVPRALRSWEREAIHQARVTTRRLKSALDLLDPVLAEEARRDFARVLRRLRRALGPLRDIDVMLAHLQEIRKQARHADAAGWLAQRLQSRRVELQREAVRKASPQEVLRGLGTWWALEEELKDAEEAAPSLGKRAIPRQLQSFVERADRLTRARSREPTQSHEDVHALRIDGKLLRYTLELAAPMGIVIPAPLLRSFKQLQDALGLWHDYVVLGEHGLRIGLDQALPLHGPRLYGQILVLAQQCWRTSERHLDRFARLWTKMGSSIQKQVLESYQMASETPLRVSQGNDVGRRAIRPRAVKLPQQQASANNV